MHKPESFEQIRFAEVSVSDILARRKKTLSKEEWLQWSYAFYEAFAVLHKMEDVLSADDYRCRNIMMHLSCEAGGQYVAHQKDVDLKELLADVKFAPVAVRSGLGFERAEAAPRMLRALRLCWEANGNPDDVSNLGDKVGAHVDAARNGTKPTR